LPQHEAELARQRDFDELFFFAGASEIDIRRFQQEASNRKVQLRQQSVLWSLVIGASLQSCIRELTKLYDRALRYHAHVVGIATSAEAKELFPHCERRILLSTQGGEAPFDAETLPHTRRFALRTPEMWELLLESLTSRA
jgi:hypothetical protein